MLLLLNITSDFVDNVNFDLGSYFVLHINNTTLCAKASVCLDSVFIDQFLINGKALYVIPKCD
jgi:hypothetical protein